ncbi:MAG: hypothetical protein K0Q51_554 [Rickettsiaceae bacterium]|jgi:flagellar hook-associated protein 2|nr:hypothetical protein [Rickettsiaceae bacterium]
MGLINLGSITNIGGKNVSSGLASGMDTKSLVEKQMEVKKKPIEDKEEQVKLNTNKINAYTQMKTLLKDLQLKAKALHNPPSPLDYAENVFNLRKVEGTTNEQESWEKYIKIDAKAGATLASHKITIKKLAVEKVEQFGASGATLATQVGFSSRTASVTKAAPAAGEFKAGTFKINNVDVTLADGDSLDTITNKINYLTSQTNVRAEVFTASSTDFRLRLISTKTGTGSDYEYTITDASSILGNLGKATVKAATDAEFQFDGMDLTRKSNTIDDVIDKIKFTLLAPNTNTDPLDQNYKYINFSLDKDKDSIKDAIGQFIIAYNDFMQFAAKQQEREEDKSFKETAYLGGDSMFKRSLSVLKNALSYTVKGIDSTKLNNLAGIGLRFYTVPANEKDNIVAAPDSLELKDEKLFYEKLDNNLDEIQKLFEFTFIGPGNKIMPRERKALLDVNNITLKIKTDGLPATDGSDTFDTNEKVAIMYTDTSNVVQTQYADFKADNDATSGNLKGVITGRAGTVIEGFSLYYLGNSTLALETIALEFTQGFADMAFLSIDKYASYDGLINEEIKILVEKNAKDKLDIERKTVALDKEREMILQKYGRLEQTIAAANRTLMFIDAYTNANNNRQK